VKQKLIYQYERRIMKLVNENRELKRKLAEVGEFEPEKRQRVL
jgi:hypothetical protein